MSTQVFINGITISSPKGFNFDDPWLPVNSTVQLNPVLTTSIIAVRPYYAKYKHKAVITSGYRSPDHQVQVIISYLKAKDMIKDLPEIQEGIANNRSFDYVISIPTMYPDFPQTVMYWWQRGWSKLLGLTPAIIINPAAEAICFEHSLREDGTDRYGSTIGESAHSKGTAFDQDGGLDHNPADEYKIMQEAMNDPQCMIKGLTLERAQSCVHTDVKLGDYILV